MLMATTFFVYRKEDGCGKRIDMYMNYNKKQ